MSTNTNTNSDTTKYGTDLRLDAIDRALLGLLPRHERIELVAQIETRIRETVAACPPVDAQCNEARLDHPGPVDEATQAAVLSSLVHPSQRRHRYSARRTPRSRLAVSSGVLGIVALSLLVALPIVYLMVSLLNMGEWVAISLVGGHVTAVALGGLLALVLGIAALVVLNRHDGRLVGHGWAITGLCTGPLPMFVGGLMALVVGAELYGTISVSPSYTASNVPPPSPSGANPAYPASPPTLTPYGVPPTYAPGASSPNYEAGASPLPPGPVPQAEGWTAAAPAGPRPAAYPSPNCDPCDSPQSNLPQPEVGSAPATVVEPALPPPDDLSSPTASVPGQR